MKNMLVAMGLMALVTVSISGCTTWHGISQTDKPGNYYITTSRLNFPLPGVSTGMLLCTADTIGNLSCHEVKVRD